MSQSRLLAALGVLATAAAASTAAAATTSHAKFWENPSGKVVCGVRNHPKNKPATEVLCSAKGIPRHPKHGGSGDPFVQIAATGSPQLVLISQFSWQGTKATKLSAGTTWSSLGVTCKIKLKTVTCSNGSGHGFTIGDGKYKSF